MDVVCGERERGRGRGKRGMNWGSGSGVETEGAMGSVLVFLHRSCMRLPGNSMQLYLFNQPMR